MVGTSPTVLPDNRMASRAAEHASMVSSTAGPASVVGSTAMA